VRFEKCICIGSNYAIKSYKIYFFVNPTVLVQFGLCDLFWISPRTSFGSLIAIYKGIIPKIAAESRNALCRMAGASYEDPDSGSRQKLLFY
jgi:hypothetical protein